MDSFLKKAKDSAPSGETDTASPGEGHRHQPKSSSDLFASAKVVAEAGKASFGGGGSGEMDKGRVAGAASDLLDAGCEYGKLDETKGFGSYVKKAETYLDQYQSSNPSTAVPTPAGGDQKKSEGGYGGQEKSEGKSEGGYGDYLKKAEGFLGSGGAKPSSNSGGDEEKSEGKSGDYLKMAEGFLGSGGTKASTNSGGDEEKSGGDYLKMAGGFMKK